MAVSERLVLRGIMRSHTDMVTAIATPADKSDFIVSSSRDKSLVIWDLTKDQNNIYGGVPRYRLGGHSDSVQDVVLNSTGSIAVSASCDGDVCLWDLTKETWFKFAGHTDAVHSVAIAPDDCCIVSASRDGTIKIWNTIGECRCTFQGDKAHTDCVTRVRFHPRGGTTPQTVFVTSSWDKTVKVWDQKYSKSRSTCVGHTSRVNAMAVSPDGSLIASGGDDGEIWMWDSDDGTFLKRVDAGSAIHSLCFSPNRYWLCAATEKSILVLDLQDLDNIVQELKIDIKAEGTGNANNKDLTYCTSLSWSADGSTLFSGYSDGVIRVWGLIKVWGFGRKLHLD